MLDIIINDVHIANKTINVIRGQPGSVKAKLVVERGIYRPNQTVIAKMSLTNLGDTDALTPVGLLSTVDLDKVSPVGDIDDLDISYQIVSVNNNPYISYPYDNFIAFSENGPGGVIQARSTAYIRFEIRPTSDSILGRFPISFYTYDSDNFLYNFLVEKIDNYKIRGVSQSAWSILSNYVLEKARSPLAQQQLLYETVNVLSAHDIKTYRLDELVNYHINRIDGAFLEGN